jgi:hypothetical protein
MPRDVRAELMSAASRASTALSRTPSVVVTASALVAVSGTTTAARAAASATATERARARVRAGGWLMGGGLLVGLLSYRPDRGRATSLDRVTNRAPSGS